MALSTLDGFIGVSAKRAVSVQSIGGHHFSRSSHIKLSKLKGLVAEQPDSTLAELKFAWRKKK